MAWLCGPEFVVVAQLWRLPERQKMCKCLVQGQEPSAPRQVKELAAVWGPGVVGRGAAADLPGASELPGWFMTFLPHAKAAEGSQNHNFLVSSPWAPSLTQLCISSQFCASHKEDRTCFVVLL